MPPGADTMANGLPSQEKPEETRQNCFGLVAGASNKKWFCHQ
jgi:hypothetical protein